MNKQNMIAKIKQNFLLKRTRAQEKCDEYIAELRQDSEFDTLYSEYSKKNIEYLKTKINEENVQLREDVEDLKIKIDTYLKSHHIPQANLLPQYDCPICNDTGVVGGRICSCLLNELNSQISKQTSSQSEFKNFGMANPTLMNDTDKAATALLQNWCEKYPNISKININIIGGVGAGKTFMMECVASELKKKNCTTSFITAFELNELARMYHAGKSYDFADYLNVDVLLIDDLGTEPVIKNVTKEYLYNLINTRQTHKRPTFITSNLTLDNILDRYDERIFSRLANKNLCINILLDSPDKRIKC